MSKISVEKQLGMKAQHFRDQILASFSTKHRERISRIAEHGPSDGDDDDNEMCSMMAYFILGEVLFSAYESAEKDLETSENEQRITMEKPPMKKLTFEAVLCAAAASVAAYAAAIFFIASCNDS